MYSAGFQGASQILTSRDEEVSEACHYLITPSTRSSSLSENTFFAEAERMMSGSREDRVVAFDRFLRRSDDMDIAKLTPETMSFMLGYLASRIAPGTIRHASVLNQITHRYPTAILWYGFCSGFGESELNVQSANRRRSVDLPSSARRVIRELLRPEPFIGAPVGDIGYLELIALSRTGGDPLEGVVKAAQGAVSVELLPGVYTLMNVSSNQPTKLNVREFQEREVIALGEQIERLRETYKKLLGAEATSKAVEQGSLFPPRRKKKL
jgi:hypothetical protein